MPDLATNVLNYGDNLDILRRYLPDAAVDLVYLDRPFNSNRDDNVIFGDESGNTTKSESTSHGGLPSPRSSWVLGCALATIAILAGACSPSFQPTAPPTVAETRAFIIKMVQLAQAREFGQLCELGGGNCEHILDSAGANNAPADPPTVARIYVVPSVKHADGSWSQGGQMVEMCGIDGSGVAYQTQMIVFRDQTHHVIAIEPIYWSGLHIRVDAEQPVGPKPSGPPFAC